LALLAVASMSSGFIIPGVQIILHFKYSSIAFKSPPATLFINWVKPASSLVVYLEPFLSRTKTFCLAAFASISDVLGNFRERPLGLPERPFWNRNAFGGFL
jgi:hypothetical protein